MSATPYLCERNGAFPGNVTENIQGIQWKAVDDVITNYAVFNAVIGLGTNSYRKYNYLKFSGFFTTLGNVKIKHLSGKLATGVRLVSSDSITLDGQKIPYTTPGRNYDTTITPKDLSSINTTVQLLVGPQIGLSDPANSTGKQRVNDNSTGTLYSNYFVTQLLTSPNANTGDTGPIVLQITWDEV